MTEHVDQLQQVVLELLQSAEKESNPKKRARLTELAREYQIRAEQFRAGRIIDVEAP